MKHQFSAGIISLISGILLSGCSHSTADLAPVQDFEVGKYLGRWYEIVRLPHYFERGLDEVTAEYSLNPDGTVKVINRGQRNGEKTQIIGKAKLKYPEKRPLTGELRVSFFGPFYSDYRIIELAQDYSYAVVTGANRNFLWILSRQPVMPQAQLQEILSRLKEQGFATEKLEYPRQSSAKEF
ncbi:MAG: lipocalin family protein [Lentisphaeria bacterium]|nr:lipocalin family protein [Lentisphaeria bacterium]